MERILCSKRDGLLEIFKNIVFNTPRNICNSCECALELPPRGSILFYCTTCDIMTISIQADTKERIYAYVVLLLKVGYTCIQQEKVAAILVYEM